MTEQEIRDLTTIVHEAQRLAFDPINETLARMLTLLEHLTNRVEVLELEVLHRK